MEAVRDLREGGHWSLAQRIKNDGLYGLVVVVLAVARVLPARFVGRVLAAIAWRLPSPRRIALSNLARVFPDRSAPDRHALARENFRALGDRLGEAIHSLHRAPDPLAWAPGSLEVLEAALAEGNGVLFASAHLGPWENVAATMVASGLPITVIAREAYDPRLTPLYERLRGGRGVHAIWRGSKGAARGLLRVLRRGELLGIPMDLASRVPSETIPFLGIDAPTPIGPARLAIRTGAAVVVGSVAPSPEGLVLSAVRLSRTDDAITLTTWINQELSRRILAIPELWPWMHARFGSP